MVMRTIIQGVMDLLKGREKVIVGKEEIMSILPHRGRMLLLDRVIITNETVTGEFLVTEDVCEGHQFNGHPVFRGIDTLDMAAQLLGVWAAQHFDTGALAVVRRYGGTKFVDKVIPSDTIVVVINVKDLKIEIVGRPGREIKKVIGINFSARVGRNPKAEIALIELIVVDSQSLA